jgi:AraC-like DNA-binding protein
LFENSGGVVHYIQRQRLLNAYDILSDPLSRRSILSISEDLCFADASSFTRAFRHEFGCSPSEVRSAAAKGSSIPPASRAQPSPGAASFGDLLRTA